LTAVVHGWIVNSPGRQESLLQLNAHPGRPGRELRSRLIRCQRNHNTLVVDHTELTRTSGYGKRRLASDVVTR
jgi:hypothetical protein